MPTETRSNTPWGRTVRSSLLLLATLVAQACSPTSNSPMQLPPSPGNDPPTPSITSPGDSTTITIFDLVTMTGTASDLQDGTNCCGNTFRWLNEGRDLIGTGMSASQDSFVIGSQALELEVKDLDGNVGTALVTLNVKLPGELVYETTFAGGRADTSDGLNITSATDGAEWPVFSPDGFRMAYTKSDGNDSEIFVASALGEVQLTDNNADDLSPTWSPDGTRIAYSSNVTGDYEIYVMNSMTGKILSRVTNQAGLDIDPDWSTSGIVWEYFPNGGDRNIWFVANEGANAMQLTTSTAADRDPRWTFDGMRIVFSSTRDGDREVYIMDADGSNQTRLTNHPGEDKEGGLSPDGTTLAWVSDRGGVPQIWIAKADGSMPVVYAAPLGPDHTRWKP